MCVCVGVCVFMCVCVCVGVCVCVYVCVCLLSLLPRPAKREKVVCGGEGGGEKMRIFCTFERAGKQIFTGEIRQE